MRGRRGTVAVALVALGVLASAGPAAAQRETRSTDLTIEAATQEGVAFRVKPEMPYNADTYVKPASGGDSLTRQNLGPHAGDGRYLLRARIPADRPLELCVRIEGHKSSFEPLWQTECVAFTVPRIQAAAKPLFRLSATRKAVTLRATGALRGRFAKVAYSYTCDGRKQTVRKGVRLTARRVLRPKRGCVMRGVTIRMADFKSPTTAYTGFTARKRVK